MSCACRSIELDLYGSLGYIRPRQTTPCRRAPRRPGTRAAIAGRSAHSTVQTGAATGVRLREG